MPPNSLPWAYLLVELAVATDTTAVSMAPDLLVFISENVYLSELRDLSPATIIVNLETGKVIEILTRCVSRAEYKDVPDERWIDVGSDFILPGLVE